MIPYRVLIVRCDLYLRTKLCELHLYKTPLDEKEFKIYRIDFKVEFLVSHPFRGFYLTLKRVSTICDQT